tara:strand:+ start:93 stop:407 length:315 start_codon:yes stop_codon:yes gene_type:complete
LFFHHLGSSAATASLSTNSGYTSSDLSVISCLKTGFSSCSIISYSYLTLRVPFFFYVLPFFCISFFISGSVFFVFLAQIGFLIFSNLSLFTSRLERAAFRLKTN